MAARQSVRQVDIRLGIQRFLRCGYHQWRKTMPAVPAGEDVFRALATRVTKRKTMAATRTEYRTDDDDAVIELEDEPRDGRTGGK